MYINKKLAVAALTGLLSTTYLAPAFAEDNSDASIAEKTESASEKSACNGKNGCSTNKDSKEKHACKGLNSCKGNSPDGKNECKGKSACATDGSK
jgi:hypothetical protein